MSAGADCVHLLSDDKRALTLDELIDLLETGAIITPVNDFVSLKTSLEEACILLKDRCTQDIKKKLNDVNKNLQGLINVDRNAESNNESIGR